MSRFIWARYLFIATAIIVLTYMGFVLSMPQPTSAAALTCTNLLQNSNMEGGGGWLFGMTPAQGGYSTAQYVSPFRSARLGITTGYNVYSYSSMRQVVFIPTGPPGQTLRLRLQVKAVSQPLDPVDGQEILIMDASGTNTLRTVWSTTSNAGVWQPVNVDVSEFIGQTIMVYINVFNNGAGGRTAMFVDDVYLEVCTGAAATSTPTSGFITATPTSGFVTATPTSGFVTATPTSGFITATPTLAIVTNTPTPTVTPNYVTATPTLIVVTNTPTAGFITATPTLTIVTNTPTAIPPIPTLTPTPPYPDGTCLEMLLNTSFENWEGWSFGKTKLQPGYVYDNPRTGMRSVLTGNVYYDRPNYNSYSSVRQRVSLPRGPFTTAYLEFWHYTISDLEPDDYQELVILDARGKTLGVLWRENRNDQQWLVERFDMTRFLGKSIYVYFNARNRGGLGRASMYVDDASLILCSDVEILGSTPPSGQQPVLIQTSTPSPVTTPEFVLDTTTPSASPTTGLVQPGFATVTPVSVPAVTAPVTGQVTTTVTLTSPASMPATATTNTGQVAGSSTPTTMPEILATPTPLGAGELIPEETTANIWKIIRQALWYAVVAIGFLLLAFLAYRVIMGWRKQK